MSPAARTPLSCPDGVCFLRAAQAAALQPDYQRLLLLPLLLLLLLMMMMTMATTTRLTTLMAMVIMVAALLLLLTRVVVLLLPPAAMVVGWAGTAVLQLWGLAVAEVVHLPEQQGGSALGGWEGAPTEQQATQARCP